MKNINIPETWTLPKHHYGKQVQQGEIVGMEYHHPGTQAAYELGEGWFYTVMVHKLEAEIETAKESDIALMNAEELQAEIDSLTNLINAYQGIITTLNQQLSQLNQCNN